MDPRSVTFVFLLALGVHCDVFLHNPRGSNNRMNEANTNSNNNNRLFDSQNNGKGGYCYGPPMSYYEGSLLLVEWTGTHGCSNPKVDCTYVLQYMCGAADAPAGQRIRDGFGTDTVPETIAGTEATDANGELLYGMHESLQYYSDCTTRDRNMGLYIADRELGQQGATFTRQKNGIRNGFECPEERDYYPYWHPSPWKDIAVLVDDVSHCPFYQAESQNVKPKNFCFDIDSQSGAAPNNQANCVAQGFTWETAPAFGIPAPACQKNQRSETNDNGNVLGGYFNSYQWTLPSTAQEPCIGANNCNCVLRLRYNITSLDLGTNQLYGPTMLSSTSNGAASPVKEDDVISQGDVEIQIAADTSQFGRTFQDRSYVFHIKPRAPAGVSAAAVIHNLNVKGKRGNNVQVYPAVEYGFIPEVLGVSVNDFIHFQWTGCDTNPNGNAGEGIAGTDRSNVVQIADLSENVPASDAWLLANTPLFPNAQDRVKMGYIDQQACLTYVELMAQNGNSESAVAQDPQNCMLLNAAPRYFDGGLVQMTSVGEFYYMSTRNNNFSNRSHKGVIISG